VLEFKPKYCQEKKKKRRRRNKPSKHSHNETLASTEDESSSNNTSKVNAGIPFESKSRKYFLIGGKRVPECACAR
jgi:hypothetical protein